MLLPSALQEMLSERLEAREHRRLLELARAGTTACLLAHDDPEPLVSVCIPTLVRDGALLTRAIRAALSQTHQRLEVVVVNDGNEGALASACAEFDDPRLRLVTIEPIAVSRARRGIYGHYSSASGKRNVALALARGSWIAPSDDDDEMAPDHVESLLREGRARRAELVYSQARVERSPGTWEIVGWAPLQRGGIVQGSVLYSAGLRFVQYRPTCWKVREWDDWNLFRRMQRIGVRIAFLEQVTYTHHLEAPQRDLAERAVSVRAAG